MSNGSTIYHLCLGDGDNHYFGSISAIFDNFTSKQLNVSKYQLWEYGITAEKPYQNDKCTIYKDVIHRKKGNRGFKSNENKDESK